jgi:hypothetical protein
MEERLHVVAPPERPELNPAVALALARIIEQAVASMRQDGVREE